MTLTLNGEPCEVGEGTTLDALIETLGVRRDGIAAALNDEVVPRGRHATTHLQQDDRLEIIVAVAGG